MEKVAVELEMVRHCPSAPDRRTTDNWSNIQQKWLKLDK